MNQMLAKYIAASNDTAILNRALPLAEACSHSALSLPVTDSIPQRELAWWSNNRSLDVTSPYTKKTFTLFRYAVSNSAPRPEAYLTGISCDCSFTVHSFTSLYQDYETASDPTLNTLNESERAELYSELASGAETGQALCRPSFRCLTDQHFFLGWDYSTRFVSLPVAGGTNFTAPALRSFNVKSHIPVDLNAILCKLHVHMSRGTILHSFQTRQTLSLQISTCQGDMVIVLSPRNTEPLRPIFALASSICSGILRNLHFTTSISPQTRAIAFCRPRRSTHSGQVSFLTSLFPTQAMRLVSSRVSTWFSDAIMVHTHPLSLNLVSNGMLRMHGRRINISRWRP